MKRVSRFSGEQVAQVANPDPFAIPVWRSPVYRTSIVAIFLVQAARVAGKLYRLIRHHPVLTGTAVLVWWLWHLVGWPGPVFLANVIVTTAGVWWFLWPRSFTRLILRPAYGRWRRQHYHRHWPSVMTIGHLAPAYQGRLLLPVLGKVVSTRYTDRVSIRLVSGQSAEDYARRADNLAHGFGAVTCRVRTAKPGRLVLEFVRRDALAAIIAALPIPAVPDLGALPVGKREDGSTWTIRLHGTHVIIAGSTGAGKDSLVWCLVRAMLPAMKEGLARVLAADPKVMELAYGRAIFDTYGTYEAEPERIADMLEDAVAAMRERAGQLAGTQRSHTPSPEHPFVVIIVDEVAFLTAYHPSKDLRERIKAALATLTTQGRAVGYCVVAALQDPRKEVMSIRNLFPDRIAMRLDEPEQVDMVLGDGARDRGAAAELISTNPDIGAGVAYVRLESDPDPVRVRAAWVSDADITAMAAGCEPPAPPLRAAA